MAEREPADDAGGRKDGTWTLTARLPAQLEIEVGMARMKAHKKLKDWVREAIEEKLEEDRSAQNEGFDHSPAMDLTGSQIALAVRQADAGLPPRPDDRRFEYISLSPQDLDRAAAVLVAVGVGTAAPTEREDVFLVRRRVEHILDILRIPYQRQAWADGALTA